MPRIRELKPITSVWSSYGHRFIDDGNDVDDWGNTTESCLTCGAVYTLRRIEGTRGEYVANDGSSPMPCTGDTAMAHGYPGERVCHASPRFPIDDCPDADDDGDCPHTRHDCNCLLCNS